LCASIGNKRGFSIVDARCNHEVLPEVLLKGYSVHITLGRVPAELLRLCQGLTVSESLRNTALQYLSCFSV